MDKKHPAADIDAHANHGSHRSIHSCEKTT